MISLQNISKSYASTKALQQVSLDFQQGSCFGLVGPNGAGKSTLMKIIAGIISKDQGTIHIDNKEKNPQRKTIGYVPQEICLSDTLTVEQNLVFFGSIYHFKGKALKNRMNTILDYIGLEDKRKKKVHTLSGGMKRRLNIGCALIHDPEIILLDEPTVGIDPHSRHYILQMIQQMKQSNRIIIYSSHYMEEVEKICDAVAFLDHGKLLIQQRTEKLLEQYTSPAIFVKWEEGISVNKEKFGCTNMQPFRNGFKIEDAQPLQQMERIVRYCIQHQLPLEKLELMKPSLEEVFFSFTGQELRG